MGRTPRRQERYNSESGSGAGGSVDGEDIEPRSVNTDHSLSEYQPNSGLSPWANTRAQGQKQIPIPKFELDPDNPKLTADDIDWSSASVSDPVEIHWPSVQPTAQLPDALADNYCYFTPHDSEGVGLAHFDDPFSSWETVGSPVIDDEFSEVSTLYNDEEGELWMYSNKPNNKDMARLRSDDGRSDFTDDGVIYSAWRDKKGHAGYPRAIRTPDNNVAVLSFWKGAEDHASQSINLSPDGEAEWVHLTQDWTERARPTGIDNRWLHTALLPYAPLNGYYAFYVEERGAIGRDRTGDIRVGWTQHGIVIHDLGVAISGDAQEWMDGNIADPDPFWYDGDLYLAIAGDSSGGNGAPTKLGVAVADFSEVKA